MKEWWNRVLHTKFHIGWVFLVLSLILAGLVTKLVQLV